MKKLVLWVSLVVIILSLGHLLSKSRHYQIFGILVTHINTTEKIVALTFDDGPTEFTNEILAVLAEENVKASFFLTGREIENYPKECQKIIKAGHEIGNHSYSHSRLVFKSYARIKNEIERTDSLIRQNGYKGEIYFRPPYCKKLFTLPYYLKKNKRSTYLWSMEPDTYLKETDSEANLIKYINENISPGDIILLHTMYISGERNRKALKGIIKALKEKGYRFIKLSEKV